MPEVIESQPKALSRRDRFREYMKRLNPSAPAREAIEAGLVVDDLHQSLYQKLAARADLEPGSQQLLAGGVGSGKTTQLLLAVDWLRRQGNTIPLYVDVAAWTDLSRLKPGAVLAAFGVRMATEGLNRFTLTRDEHDALLQARDKLMEFPFEEDTPEGAGRPLYHPMPVLKRHFPWAGGLLTTCSVFFARPPMRRLPLSTGLTACSRLPGSGQRLRRTSRRCESAESLC